MALRSTVIPSGQDLPRGQNQTCIKRHNFSGSKLSQFNRCKQFEGPEYDEEIALAKEYQNNDAEPTNVSLQDKELLCCLVSFPLEMKMKLISVVTK